MKHLDKFRKTGFTLIELLIVIALLGALAVGLLATVDPFEQLKKGRDTSTRNTAAEFYNAVIRYYAQRGSFPGELTAVVTTQSLNSVPNAMSELASGGELKTDFTSLAGTGSLARIYVTTPTTESIVVCTNPESKAFRNDQNSKFDITGAVQATTTCPNSTSTSCFVCFK